MSESNQTPLNTNVDAGMLDEFGMSTAGSNGQIQYFTLPSEFASMPQDGWDIAQWGSAVPINVADYTINNPASYDDIYGNATYDWSSPTATSAVALYNNPSSMGGGEVVQVTDSNTATFTPNDVTNEADMFLQAPSIPAALGNLGNPITLSMNLKVTQSNIQWASAYAEKTDNIQTEVSNSIGVDFYVTFNGAGNLQKYSGFVQICPWHSDSSANSAYFTAPIENSSVSASPFVTGLLLGANTGLPLLPSDANATPEALTFSLNEYVLASLTNTFSNFTAEQKAALFNLTNWRMTGMVYGLANNDEELNDPTTGNTLEVAASVSATLQMSDINLTTNQNATYTSTSTTSSTPVVNTNPTLSFIDETFHDAAGNANGGSYVGSITNINDEYFYTGFDDVELTINNGQTWMIGAGNGNTTISATNGSYSVEITPFTGTSREIDLLTPAQNIYIDNYASPSITTQSLTSDGLLHVTLMDDTTIVMADPTGDMASITNGKLVENLPVVTTPVPPPVSPPSDGVPCFLAYTQIKTPDGFEFVQNLKIGDLILNVKGKPIKVKWIGKRSYTGSAANKIEIMPIEIQPDAIERGIPSAMLLVSPCHGIAIDGLLVPAGALVNGMSIKSRACPRIDYFHIETENHDIVLANNTPAETFIDANSRNLFDNAAEFHRLYPNDKAKKFECLPRLEFGFILESIRKRLALRVGMLMQPKKDRAIIGVVESIQDGDIIGWACSPDDAGIPCSVEIINAQGLVLNRTVANLWRNDVRKAGVGTGWHGFKVSIPHKLRAEKLNLVMR
jgi:hypothetical protein